MTDDELDRARAEEGLRIWARSLANFQDVDPNKVMGAATFAARLAREGWVPPDPLMREAEDLYNSGPHNWWHYPVKSVERLRAALERGIEIGKGG